MHGPSNYDWEPPRNSLLALADSSIPREAPVWLASMFLHMLLITTMGVMVMPPVKIYVRPALEASIIQPPPEEEPQKKIEIEKQDFDLTPSELPNVGSARPVGQEVEFSAALRIDTSVELPRRLPEVSHLTDVRVPLVLDITKAPNRAVKAQIKGVAGDGVVGTLGAIDRITQEILRSLESGPTLVVWLFDQSGSMQVQREAVHKRFDQVYAELGLSKAVAPKRGIDQPLLTSIVAFGKEVSFITEKPTDDLKVIKEAVAGIKNDDSGVEMTFTAVGMTAQKYEPYRLHTPRRQVMMILLTDEVGDDENRLEDCVQICKRNQIPVYVAGVPAPFGRRNIEIKYVDPDPNYDQSVQWIPVRQGPETLLPEMVQLNFSGKPNRDDAIYRLDSGFGPYSLTRLCYETGGIFFAVHANRERVGEFVSQRDVPVFQARLNHFFDPLVMRPYRPDYLTAAEYMQSIAKNRAKSALIEAAKQSTVDPMNNPELVFRRDPENEASMKRSLDEAQRAAALVQPRVDLLYSLIKQGEKDREKLVEPRWRAGYDLALGRILAVKVRTEVYNLMLARAKGGMKYDDPRTNVLRLVPADDISVNSQLAKMADQARTLLQGVAHEHRGTPWAMWAEAELKDPIGWKWKEEYDPPPKPQPPVKPQPKPVVNNPPKKKPANNNPPQFRRETPKPVRQNVKL
jgi:hypothetical protein